MGRRVKDGGGSESRSVMERIGVAPTHIGDITPRENGQTSAGSGVTRNGTVTPKQEFVEMGADAGAMHSSDCWREPAYR